MKSDDTFIIYFSDGEAMPRLI